MNILAAIRELEKKIGGVDYDSYMKEHPASKKQRNDPMFTQPVKQPAAPAKAAPAPAAAPAKQSPAPAAKKSVSDFSDDELKDLFGFSDRKNITDAEALQEYNAKQEYENLLKSKKIAPKDEDEYYSSYLRVKKRESEKPRPDFNAGDYYNALHKHIGYNADLLTPKYIREVVKKYFPKDRLSDVEVKHIIGMYEDRNRWG